MYKMTDQELITRIADIFKIGKTARAPQIILTNIENAYRRSACLSKIENYHTEIIKDDFEEDSEVSKLNWGEDPEEYIETYKKIIKESSPAERMVMPKITEGNLRIIYKNNKPYGIRDTTGFLFFFTNISKYTGQEERYREEIEQQYRLADFLLSKLKENKSNFSC